MNFENLSDLKHQIDEKYSYTDLRLVLNDLESSQIDINAKSVNTTHDVTETTIIKPQVDFRSGKGIKKMLDNLSYLKVNQ